MANNIFIIAEIGSVHDGSLGNAMKLIELSAKCGVDCVKFQTHISTEECLPDSPNPTYFKEEPRFDYFNRTAFSLDQWKSLKKKADECKIKFISSPFSIEAVDILEEVDVFAYKIASGEVTNLPLLEKISAIGKPVYLSSGMSNWDELDSAVDIFKNKCDLTVMQCSSIYPCPPEQVGLNIITEIKERYNCKVGFSDHTRNFAAAISAVAMEATVIEKHFTFSRHMYGSDAKNSMEPEDFYKFCMEIRDAVKIHENPIDKDDLKQYKEMRMIFQKSIVASCDILEKTKINIHHIKFKKPGDGIPANKYKNVLGKKTVRRIYANQKLTFNDLI